MSRRPLGAPRSREERPGSAAQFVAGCMYRVVQTTGPDGKNLLKLLPIPKSSGNVVPLIQSSAMSNNPKVKISSPVHLTFKTQLGRTTAPSSVKLPVFQSPNPGKIILARALDKQGGVRAGSEKESLPAKSAPNAKSSCVPAARTLQHVAVTSSSEQGKAAGVLGNTKPVPNPMKSPVLPSGHHLQIPADAEVKSVPASLLPPSIQQKILAAAAANESSGAEAKKMPTVIFVSPVNTVKTVLPKSLQAVCSKPATDASKTLIMTAAQKARGSPGAATPAGQQCHAPMKWIVQESPQPCLIPVKSSNNVASKILKTLSDAKNVEVSSASILPLCSSGPGGSQAKITPLKDNALVMYSGKVYLLTKKGSDVLLDQAGIQASSSCGASSRKGTSKLIDSTEVLKIRNKVMNLVLSKSKEMALSQKGPKTCTNSKDPSPAGFSNDLKSAPAALVTPSVKEQSSTVPQGKGLAFTESVSSGTTPVPALGTGQNACQDGEEMIHSPKAASAVLPQSKQECAFSEDWQKVQHEEMQSLGSGNQTEHQEKPRRKKYSKLRKKFGLYKEERVYLKRIPLMTCEKPGGRGCSSDSSERRNDSCSSSSLDVAPTDQQHKCIKEEKITVDLEEEVSKKRKIKSAPLTDSGKRRKTSGKSTTNSGTEDTGPSSITCSRSVSPPAVLLQPSVSTDFVTPSVGRDVEQEPSSQNSDVTDSDIPVLVSCEDRAVLEGSFRDDAFPLTPPDLAETIRDEKIKRLKQLLREREAALEEMRRKMQQT